MAKEKKTSVESLFLSREGFSEINKICNYLSTLIVKNESEAFEYETDFTYNNYSKYEASYMDSRSIFLYNYTDEDLEQFFSKDWIEKYNLRVPDTINKLIMEKNTAAIALLDYLQSKFLNNYVEYNQYYRQFMGKPMDANDRVAVLDLDSKNPNEYVAIHDVNKTEYPKTYEHYFVKRNIESLIIEYSDIDYLKFIENPISPYRIRRSPDFTIFYSDEGLLDEDELSRFKKAYNKARIYVSEQMYVTGISKRFAIYGNLMYLLILFYTVNNYFNLKLEDYSLRKYTRYDIYDILESNGLKNLTKISDLSLLKKIVMKMDDLNRYKGTEYILNLLFEILDDKTITIKRSYLLKDYRILNTGYLEFDTDNLYQSSVGLKFIDEPIAINEENLIESTNKKEIDYDFRTYSDDLWGGIDSDTSSDLKNKLKEDLRINILKTDFNKIKTKYLSISKSMNIIEKSLDTINILYLVLKFYYGNERGDNNPFKTETISFSGIESRPIEYLATFFYLNNVMNGLEEPWIISPDRNFFSSIYLMRTTSEVYALLDEIKEKEIDIGNPLLNKTISQMINDDKELLTYLTKYNLTANSTIKDVLDQYEKSKEVFELLNQKLIDTSDSLMYNTYKELYNYNKNLYDFTELFEGETDYREYLGKKNVGLLNYIETLIQPVLDGTKTALEVVKEPFERLTTVIEDFINLLLDGHKYFAFSSTKEETKYLEDLKILMNEYLSIFSELYSVEQVIEVNDEPNNYMKFTYFQLSRKYITTMFEKLQFRYKIARRLFKDQYFDTLSFKEKVKILAKCDFEDLLSYRYELISSHIILNVYDKINFFYQLLNIKSKQNFKDNLNFDYKLIDFQHKD